MFILIEGIAIILILVNYCSHPLTVLTLESRVTKLVYYFSRHQFSALQANRCHGGEVGQDSTMSKHFTVLQKNMIKTTIDITQRKTNNKDMKNNLGISYF